MKAISNVRNFTGDEKAPELKSVIQKSEPEQKNKVLAYLKSFNPDCAAGMFLTDEITGKTIEEGVKGYEDGEYYWDTREIYHFEKYNMKLNEDFIEHVLNQ